VSPALTPAQQAALAAVADRVIPEDDHGPGATGMGAHVAALRALDGDVRAQAPAVRAALDALGDGFAAAGAEAQDAALARLEREDPGAFGLLRTLVVEGAFGDPAHGGNRDGAGWRLIGYPGPRAVMTAEDQAIRELA
jgi:hypothetical protein